MLDEWYSDFGARKKPAKLVDELDEVYMKRSVADVALVRAARESTLPVIIASFFPASLERVERAFAQGSPNSVGALRRLSRGAWPRHPLEDGTPWLLNAYEASPTSGFDAWLTRADKPFLFLFVEHFPRWSTERTALGTFEEASVTHPHRVRFFVGLDEPLMRAFAGERVIKLMQTMGMAEDEKLTHSMIDKSLVNAQKKIDERSTASLPAKSDEEWFQLNLR